MCLDTEMIVGLILFWIVAPMLFVGGLVFAGRKIINIQTKKLK